MGTSEKQGAWMMRHDAAKTAQSTSAKQGAWFTRYQERRDR